LKCGDFREANEKLTMFEAGFKILTENGYTPIGLDHFAKDTDELSIALKNRNLHRNFQGYCTRETTGQVYAFGSTGISQLESVYAQNEKKPDKYVELINNNQFTIEKGYHLNIQEKIIRHVINEIMCNEYVSFKETADKFNTSEEEIKNALHFDEKMFSGFVADDLLRIDGEENFQITKPAGFLSGTSRRNSILICRRKQKGSPKRCKLFKMEMKEK
jgi:oxygen-independent coproporphyrinogen III oxidase